MRNHLLYTKQKTFMKKEAARKTSSKRLFAETKNKIRETNPKINNFMLPEQRKSVFQPVVDLRDKDNSTENHPFYN